MNGNQKKVSKVGWLRLQLKIAAARAEINLGAKPAWLGQGMIQEKPENQQGSFVPWIQF